VQAAPIKPTVKAPGSKRLKLRYDFTAFKFCFQIQLAPVQRGRLAGHLAVRVDDERRVAVTGGQRGHGPGSAPRPLVHHGKAVQINPIKPTLKAPEIKLLKLEYDKPLSNFAFKFNLCRYIMDAAPGTRTRTWWTVPVPAVPPAVRPTVDDPTLKTLVACVALPYPRASAAAGAPLLMFPKRDAFWKIRVTALVTSAFMPCALRYLV